MKGGYVYIITNTNNTVIYVGVTSNLYARTYQHKVGAYPGFTKKYNCNKLVYWESLNTIEEAIQREKRLKKYTRIQRENLISKANPDWIDLFNQVEDMQ
jgi:putative endonuclease